MPKVRPEIKSKLVDIAVKAKHHDLFDKIADLHGQNNWEPSYLWTDASAYMRLCRLEDSARILKRFLDKKQGNDSFVSSLEEMMILYD